jgi:hypothetical protein
VCRRQTSAKMVRLALLEEKVGLASRIELIVVVANMCHLCRKGLITSHFVTLLVRLVFVKVMDS